MNKINLKAIAIGILLFVALNGAIDWYSFSKGPPPMGGYQNIWDEYIYFIISGIIVLIPGFFTGYIAKTNSIRHGLIVSIIGSLIIGLGPSALYYKWSPYYDFAYSALIKYGIYCVVMSIVGEFYYLKSSNNQLQATQKPRA